MTGHTRRLLGLAICSPSPDRLDPVARAEDGELWHKTLAAETWSGWESLGGRGTVAPAVAASVPSRIELFAIGTKPIGSEYELLHRRFDGAWSDWVSYGRLRTHEPAKVMLAAVAISDGRLETIFSGLCTFKSQHGLVLADPVVGKGTMGGSMSSSPDLPGGA